MAEKNHKSDMDSSIMPASETARALLAGFEVPESIAENMALFLRLVRKVLDEYDSGLRRTFDVLLADAIRANADEAADTPAERAAFEDLERVIDGLDERSTTLVMRAFVAYFHLANICEERYRVDSLREREAAERINDFDIVENGLTDEEAHQEASRCLRCDHFGFGAFRGGRIEQW